MIYQSPGWPLVPVTLRSPFNVTVCGLGTAGDRHAGTQNLQFQITGMAFNLIGDVVR